MAKLVIFGVGKIAEVVFRHLRFESEHEIAAFACDAAFLPADQRFLGLPVVPFEEVESIFPPDRHAMFVAVGYHELNALRARKYAEAKAKGYTLISHVSPRAHVGDWLEMGDNCLVLDHVGVEPGARLGSNVALWSGVVVGHHAVIGDHCWLAANATIGGGAVLEPFAFVGLGAVVGHDVVIGEKTLIGGGALATKSAAPGGVYIRRETERFRLDSARFLKISKLT